MVTEAGRFAWLELPRGEKKAPRLFARRRAPKLGSKAKALHLGNGDGVLLADFDTAFAAQALLGVNRDSLAILHFVDVHGANLYALLVADALFSVNFYLEHKPILLVVS